MEYESPTVCPLGPIGNPSYGTCSVAVVACVAIAVIAGAIWVVSVHDVALAIFAAGAISIAALAFVCVEVLGDCC